MSVPKILMMTAIAFATAFAASAQLGAGTTGVASPGGGAPAGGNTVGTPGAGASTAGNVSGGAEGAVTGGAAVSEPGVGYDTGAPVPGGGFNVVTTSPGTYDTSATPLTADSPAYTTSTPSSPLGGSGSGYGAGTSTTGVGGGANAHPGTGAAGRPVVNEIVSGYVTLEGEVVRKVVTHPDGARFMRSYVRVREATDSAGRVVMPLHGRSVLITGDNARQAIQYEEEQVRALGTLRDRDVTEETSKEYEIELQSIQQSHS